MLFLFLSPVFVLRQISSQLPFWLTQLLLAKNQLSGKGSGVIVIPALPNSGPTNLCPVRTLLKYLDTAFGVRSKDSNRLFVPINQGQMTLLQKPFLHGFAVLSCWHISLRELLYQETRLKPMKLGQ
jgi:hypothetical protein